MDWLKLFALLVAVASTHITAEVAKKKIRIHLPQKVKHIHHHKKIYITNHAASSQYAPAYMPSAEGAVAVPTNVALPAVANIVPLNSVELYDESPHPRIPALAAAGSKILPLYRARGYYGPNPAEPEESDYDLSNGSEPIDSYIPTAFSDPSVPPPSPNYPPKKPKIVKVNNAPRKKGARKPKPKPRVVKGKPQLEEEHPVTTYHEQFYSDLDGSGTIRKIRKPPRVEKIIDGDTEHIHTYSEEHIHKLIYDDGTTKLAAVDPVVGSMSGLTSPHQLLRRPPVFAIPGDTLASLAGSLGTPSHLEYSAYNPREVTHDHIFHDHGEIPADVDVSKEELPLPPRVTYNSQGIRIGGADLKAFRNKFGQKFKQPKPTPIGDFSYYENIYSPYKGRTAPRPTNPSSIFGSTESTLGDFRHAHSPLKLKDKTKTRNVAPALYFGTGKQVSDANDPSPFAVSSTVIHDYKNKQFSSPTAGGRLNGFNNIKDSLLNGYTNHFDYDIYPSASNVYTPENKNDHSHTIFQSKKGKKKSISTQNISFGGKDHQTTVDHINDSSGLFSYNSAENLPAGFESATSTPYTIKESSPAYPYYSAMAAKALSMDHTAVAESSNDNFQYVEAPPPSTTPAIPTATTTAVPPEGFFESTEPAPTQVTERVREKKRRHRVKHLNSNATSHKDTRQRHLDLDLADNDFKNGDPAPSALSLFQQLGNAKSPYKHASLKYGDRI